MLSTALKKKLCCLDWEVTVVLTEPLELALEWSWSQEEDSFDKAYRLQYWEIIITIIQFIF